MATAELSRLDSWMNERRKGVGASEAPAILGLSPYKGDTPLRVYNHKVDGYHDADLRNESQQWGLRLEDAILDAYAAECEPVSRNTEQQLVWAKKYPWMFATLDARTESGIPVEAKSVSVYNPLHSWIRETDRLPDHWIAQGTHQMIVCGCSRMYFAVYMGEHRLRTFTLALDPEFAADLAYRVGMFWNHHVQKRIPPPPVEADQVEAVKALIPPPHGHVALGEDLIHAVNVYSLAGASSRDYDRRREEARDQILAAMGDAQVGHLPDGRTVKRSVITLKERVLPACQQVRLSVK